MGGAIAEIMYTTEDMVYDIWSMVNEEDNEDEGEEGEGEEEDDDEEDDEEEEE